MNSPTRKRAAVDDNDDIVTGPNRSSKRQKSKQKSSNATRGEKFQAASARQEQREEQESETPFGQMDAQLVSDYMARQIKRFEPDLSLVELEDRRVPG